MLQVAARTTMEKYLQDELHLLVRSAVCFSLVVYKVDRRRFSSVGAVAARGRPMRNLELWRPAASADLQYLHCKVRVWYAMHGPTLRGVYGITAGAKLHR